MKDFEEVIFDVTQCELELEEFGRLLASRRELSERDDILPFFRRSRHLSAFLGSCHPRLAGQVRLVGHEYKLVGDFGADLVVGDWARSAFCFIEFEDATPRSIFRRTSRSIPAWAPRFHQGFGQIVDWFWKLSEVQHTPDFARRFGGFAPDFVGLLVIGRTADLGTVEHDRMRWFRRYVIVNSKHVHCCTFDELYDDLRDRLEAFSRPRLAS